MDRLLCCFVFVFVCVTVLVCKCSVVAFASSYGLDCSM